MPDEYKNKLRTTILTNAGRQTFLQIGNGIGTLVYTRATLSNQSMNDSSGKPLANEIIASYSNLSNDLKDGKLQLSPVTDNHFEVIANFDNKNQQQDISFSAIGWYARIDTQSVNGQTAKGPEVLIAISPTTSDSEILAAGSPDELSTQVISAALDMTIGNAADISMKVNDISYVTRAELDAWQTKIKGVISQGYVELPVEDSERQQLHDHDGNALSFKKPLIDHDTTLSKQGSAADAYTVGRKINDIDAGLMQLDQKIYETFDTKDNAQDLKNGILANADANRDQDSEISGLQNRASELENNSQTLHLLGHNWSSISSHSQITFTASRQFFVNDNTLTNPNGYANAKATGDAINTAYQQLSHSIGLIMAILDSLDKNQVIIDIKNRLSALEEKKEHK